MTTYHQSPTLPATSVLAAIQNCTKLGLPLCPYIVDTNAGNGAWLQAIGQQLGAFAANVVGYGATEDPTKWVPGPRNHDFQAKAQPFGELPDDAAIGKPNILLNIDRAWHSRSVGYRTQYMKMLAKSEAELLIWCTPGPMDEVVNLFSDETLFKFQSDRYSLFDYVRPRVWGNTALDLDIVENVLIMARYSKRTLFLDGQRTLSLLDVLNPRRLDE